MALERIMSKEDDIVYMLIETNSLNWFIQGVKTHNIVLLVRYLCHYGPI